MVGGDDPDGFGLTILPACTDDGGSGDDSSTDAAEPTGDLSAEDQEKVDAAQAWIDDEADLDDDTRDELVFTYLYVADTPAQDTGQLVEATITGPDGETYAVEDIGMTIPDADPDGVVSFFAPA